MRCGSSWSECLSKLFLAIHAHCFSELVDGDHSAHIKCPGVNHIRPTNDCARLRLLKYLVWVQIGTLPLDAGPAKPADDEGSGLNPGQLSFALISIELEKIGDDAITTDT